MDSSGNMSIPRSCRSSRGPSLVHLAYSSCSWILLERRCPNKGSHKGHGHLQGWTCNCHTHNWPIEVKDIHQCYLTPLYDRFNNAWSRNEGYRSLAFKVTHACYQMFSASEKGQQPKVYPCCPCTDSCPVFSMRMRAFRSSLDWESDQNGTICDPHLRWTSWWNGVAWKQAMRFAFSRNAFPMSVENEPTMWWSSRHWVVTMNDWNWERELIFRSHHTIPEARKRECREADYPTLRRESFLLWRRTSSE
jgi:hypothetical protein